MKTILLSAIASLAISAPAFAEMTELDAPLQAGSLHTSATDMVAYRVDLPDGAYEVVAMFRGRTNEEPQRIMMRLEDNDEVQFSVPGKPSINYTFARRSTVVEISAEHFDGDDKTDLMAAQM